MNLVFTNDYLYIVSCHRRFSASPKSFYYYSKLFTTQCFHTPLSSPMIIFTSFRVIVVSVRRPKSIHYHSKLFTTQCFPIPMIFSSYPQTFILCRSPTCIHQRLSLHRFVSSSFQCVAQIILLPFKAIYNTMFSHPPWVHQ